MDKDVKLLNERLAQALGYAKGNEPRFMWCFAPELVYWFRPNFTSSWLKRCWADRKGKVWMLCQWRHPHVETPQGPLPIRESDWWEMFHGAYPYPGRGMYYPFAETALPPGMKPTAEMTQWYIRSLDEQMSKDFYAHHREFQEELDREEEQRETEWIERVQDMNPAFSKHELTPNSGHTAFQVPGLRDQGAA